MNDDQLTFKILSIDGGGIKGLYSARILEHFEEKFDCRISDYFDMLCGTSTGGLIALAASLRIPMSDVCSFYESEGPKIFPESKKHKLLSFILRRHITQREVQQILCGGKFSDEPLRNALEGIFGNHRIGESHNLLCIPSYIVTEARTRVFKFDHGPLGMDNKALYVDVALATSAAPTFFPMAEIPYFDYKQYIDGGVWANNPTLVGLIEALDYFVGDEKTYKKLKILSVSSLSKTGGKPVGLKRERAFIDWKEELFETSLSGQSQFTDYYMRKLADFDKKRIEYVRIPSAEISSQQENDIQLDKATSEALRLINGKGNDIGEIFKKKSEIASFFQYHKNHKIK